MQHPPATASAQALALPHPGQAWPGQQALYASVVHAPTGAAWALLLPTDLPKLPAQVWGEYGKQVEGANSVIDGHANTLAMAAAGNKLAQAVRALPGDCYLPSPLEALMLFAALSEQVGPGGIWTSRQYSADSAWVQGFSNGSQLLNGKDDEWRAVPVRRSILRSFGTSIEVA